MSNSTTASVSLHSVQPIDRINALLGICHVFPETKPGPITAQAPARQLASITTSTVLPAANESVTAMPSAEQTRLSEVGKVVPLTVIDFTHSAETPNKLLSHDQQAQALRDQELQRQHQGTVQSTSAQAAKGKADTSRAGKYKIDNESKMILQYISEDFVLLAGSTLVAYHIVSGDHMGKESFKPYCTKHYGDIVGLTEDKDGKPVEVRMSAGEVWWAWNDSLRRVVRRIVMEPTSKADDYNAEAFNRWHVLKETMAEPDMSASVDDIGILLRHLLFISDNDTAGVAFFMNWIAQLYQTPEIKIPTAILLYSKFGGVGKSILHRLLSQVFGKPLVGSCNGSALNKGFDDVVEHKRLIFVNEMARSDKVDGYERFKNMVSEEVVSFEGKGRAAKEIRNIAHYIITTNNADALPLMNQDRRVLVLRCLAQPKPDAYYAALKQWIDGPGASTTAGVLSRWVFPKEWNPHAPVPQTDATLLTQQEARDPLTAFIGELIKEAGQPFERDAGRCTALIEQLSTLYPANTKGMKLNHKSLPAALEKNGAQRVGSGTASKDNGWCWRRFDYYNTLAGVDLRAYLDGGPTPSHLSVVQTSEVTSHE